MRIRPLLLTLLLLGACFSTPPKEEHFYFLSGPTAVVERGAGPRLAVFDFTTAAGYDSQRIAYRMGDDELRYYGYRQWVSEPGRMLEEMTVRLLRASARFSEVGRDEAVRDPQAVLYGHLVAIEEIDHVEEERWAARLAMVFVVRDEVTRKVLLRHGFDVTLPCPERNPAEVARLVSKILKQQVNKLVPKIAGQIEKAQR